MADISTPNLVPDGGKLFRDTFNTTDTLPSKVLDNSKNHRERTTLYHLATQDGTWVIFDVDEEGEQTQIISISTTAGTLTVYTYDHISHMVYSEFTPSASAGDGSDLLTIRGYLAGIGMRS
jgi:hypothetical protein